MTTRVSQRIARSAALNLTRRQHGSVSSERGSGVVVKGTGIAFVSTNQITDSGNGLAQLAVGSIIVVQNSPLNSRNYEVQTSAAGAITVLPAQIQAESAGAAITIWREG